MKKILLFIAVLFISPSVNAAELTLSKNAFTILQSGEDTIDINISDDVVSGSFSVITTTNDIVLSSIDLEDNYDMSKTGSTVSFTTLSSGDGKLGTINIRSKATSPIGETTVVRVTNISLKLKDGSTVVLDKQDTNVTVVEEVVLSSDSSLKSIDSELVSITLKENTLEYDVEVKSDVDKLDLKATPNDSKAKVDISDQSKDKINITVTAEDGTSSVYKINVIKEKEQVKVKVSKSSFNKAKWLIPIVFFGVIIVLDIVYMIKKSRG